MKVTIYVDNYYAVQNRENNIANVITAKLIHRKSYSKLLK